ncbi:hypothetical protein FRUB_09917 [Fimbriiglobus ruber]|uniref:Transmembrane protein n=1 Tax=Fimbriiglobus ruber TaxID=1908690 RepID=A0A225DFA2_9BACT|nr:hypothetical protein FRUB_09917 [Fimbriiglobus ruber]
MEVSLARRAPTLARVIEPTVVEPVVAPLIALPAVEELEPVRAVPVLKRHRLALARRVRAVASPGFFHSIYLLIEWVFGAAALLVALAVLAALPVLQFLSLGYLLESAARVARSGRLRDGFFGMRTAARLGGIVLGSWLLLLPVRYVADVAHTARIIDPTGRAADGWRTGLLVLIGITAVHIATVCARGGKLRYFLWPFNSVWVVLRVARGGFYAESRDAVWDFVTSLRLPYYFWLGFRGFIGAVSWLLIPISMIAAGRAQAHVPIAGTVAFFGACLLALVLLYLPFLQTRIAVTNRLSAVWNVLEVRREFRRAPYAFAFAFVATLLFALPLYLLKIQIVPREAAWLPSLVFIAFIFPARLWTGWAMSRAARRPAPRHWFFRWTARLPLLPAAAFYVLIVFFTQYTSWNGVWSLYEQHAFLVPVPFFGL